MTVIGINGFGRIGRTLARIVATHPELGITIGAINDLTSAHRLAEGLDLDSIRGPFSGEVDDSSGKLLVNEQAIRVFNYPEPVDIPWGDAGVRVVIDSTGKHRSGEAARGHLSQEGPYKVIISASANKPDATLVIGANHRDYDPDEHHVVSPASCGVNALALLALGLLELGPLYDVSTTVLLALQGWQQSHDTLVGLSRDDPRLGRNAALNIIPHDHVEGHLLTHVLPDLGQVAYSNVCVPTPIGSMAQLRARSRAGVLTPDEVNAAMQQAARLPLRELLDYARRPTVSSDATGCSASCLFDPFGTTVTEDGLITVRGWFDGEWGFASRLLDLALLLDGRFA